MKKLLPFMMIGALAFSMTALACNSRPKTATPDEYYSSRNAHQQGSYPNNEGDSVQHNGQYRPTHQDNDHYDDDYDNERTDNWNRPLYSTLPYVYT